MKPENLGNLTFFNGLGTADLQLLAPFFVPQSYDAGSTVFEQGDQADFLYLVVKGEVVIRYKPDDGPLMTVTRVLPGGVFGWSAAMQNPIYTSGACCVLDATTVRIRGADLRGLAEEHPTLGKVILDRLAAIIAERKKICQREVISMLENNLHQESG